MIDQYKLYKYVNWFLFIIYASLSIVICIINNIAINEFGIVPIKYLSTYIYSNLPLFFTYGIFHFTNEHFYKDGRYLRFIKRRIRKWKMKLKERKVIQ